MVITSEVPKPIVREPETAPAVVTSALPAKPFGNWAAALLSIIAKLFKGKPA